MEDGMKRFALIAMLVVIAVVLVTCDMLVPEATEEWTDVEYEIEGVVGRERVKSVKLYLQPEGLERSALPGPDTYGVRVSPEQKRIIRALSADTAAASHDFFEAVFVTAAGARAGTIVRTNWEIGYPAGVSGSLLPDGDYAALTASTVFVGRKTNKTLLGVGWMTAVNDTPSTTGTKSATTTSVTFTVAPLRTWVGTWESTAGTWTLRGKSTWLGDTVDAAPGNATFVTNPAGTAATATTTVVERTRFTPVQGRDPVYYPLYALRATPGPVSAIYTIGGIVGSAAMPGGTTGGVLSAIRVFGTSAGTGSQTVADGDYATSPLGGMQVIKRKPAFLYNGRTYQAGSIYDSFTTIGALGTFGNNTHGDAFVNTIGLTFTTTAQSSGIFAITFQCPVYAITTLHAYQTNRPTVAPTNPDQSNKFIKWFIRPADGPDLYLLDSGTDEGGMVMLGDASSLSDDWIEIKTTGIGFQNN